MDAKNSSYINSVKDCKIIIMRAIEAHGGEQAFRAALMELEAENKISIRIQKPWLER